ncbi:MAG: hypothetical protein GF307_01885 [candidate division Zixibacteria bacterium]|nr:hypothetical protein [candidate division Zixibacteria bacterium]
MKIVHLADSHLGASSGSARLTPEGWNQREEDFIRVFETAIEKTVEMEPDLVLHAGDMFHIPRPTNRIIARAARALMKLADAGIPTIVISGNHDTPKQRSIGSVFQVMELVPDIEFVYQGKYERIDVDDCAVHAIPHCLSQEDFERELDQARADKTADFNILLAHGVVSSIPEFSMNEFSEQFIPDSKMVDFDYVALGHYHGYTRVFPNCYYAGSSERLSIAEAGQVKGMIELNLPGPEIKFHELPARPMVRITQIDASGMDSRAVKESIQRKLSEHKIDDAIVHLEVHDIPEETASQISREEIDELLSDAFQYNYKALKKEGYAALTEQDINIGNLELEFGKFLDNQVVENLDKEEIRKRGLFYLNTARRED